MRTGFPPLFDSPPDRTVSTQPLPDVLTRVKNEFREMPGLCLTPPQAQRLWCLDEHTCTRVLSTLVTEGYLRRSTIGYVKA